MYTHTHAHTHTHVYILPLHTNTRTHIYKSKKHACESKLRGCWLAPRRPLVKMSSVFTLFLARASALLISTGGFCATTTANRPFFADDIFASISLPSNLFVPSLSWSFFFRYFENARDLFAFADIYAMNFVLRIFRVIYVFKKFYCINMFADSTSLPLFPLL